MVRRRITIRQTNYITLNPSLPVPRLDRVMRGGALKLAAHFRVAGSLLQCLCAFVSIKYISNGWKVLTVVVFSTTLSEKSSYWDSYNIFIP